MFYTLLQTERPDGGWTGERFVCFEADSRDEAIQRVQWFGINLDENNENDYRRWEWHRPGMGTSFPKLTDHRLENTWYPGGWVIVYKNDNIRSSMAIPLNSINIPV